MRNFEKTNAPDPDGISPRELGLVALKRKWTIIATAAAVLGIATLVSFLVVPVYTANGLILIEPEPNILSFEEIFKIEPLNDDYFQTHYKLLQSRALAGDTINRMRLYLNVEFLRSVGRTPGGSPEALKNDPALRNRLVSAFLQRLAIRPVNKTRLIQASFSDRDPRLAAEALNALFDSYVEMNLQRKYQATEQATDFLSNQITSVQAEIEANEKKLQAYGQEKNIIALSRSENTVIDKLAELNKALTDAQIDRVNKETYYNEIKLATPDFIPDALSNPLIQKLREEYTRLNRDYVTRSEKYLPDYPEIQSLKVQLDAAKKAIEDETQALIKRANSDYQAALTKEQALTAVFEAQKREAFQLNSNAIQYNSLQIQIQNEKNLLESLMKRKSETDVSARLKGLRTSNIWVVDKAEVPTVPSRPNRRKNMILGLIVGLLAGLGLAMVRESLDITVKTPDDVKKFSGMTMLGMVPAYSPNGRKAEYTGPPEQGHPEPEEEAPKGLSKALKKLRPGGAKPPEPGEAEIESMDLIVHFSPKSPFSEHYRSIRTTLLFTATEDRLGALGVMSPLPREGKTATTCNLAIALAQCGKRVVIVDADLRKPRLHKVFRIKNLNGLTKYLMFDLTLEDLVRSTPIPKLFLINAGPVPPNPVELLGSERMGELVVRLKKSYDFILVDTPPLLAVSDAVVLGPQLDASILVVRGGETPRAALKLAREKLEAYKIRSLGVIINNVGIRDIDYNYGSMYRDYYRQYEQ